MYNPEYNPVLYSEFIDFLLCLRKGNLFNELTDFSIDYLDKKVVSGGGGMDVKENPYTKPKSVGFKHIYRGSLYAGELYDCKGNRRIRKNEKKYDDKLRRLVKKIAIYPNDIDFLNEKLENVDVDVFNSDYAIVVDKFEQAIIENGKNPNKHDFDVFVRLLHTVAYEMQKKHGLVVIATNQLDKYLSEDMLNVFLYLLSLIPGKVIFQFCSWPGSEYFLNDAMNSLTCCKIDFGVFELNNQLVQEEIDVRKKARELIQRQALPIFDNGGFDNDPFIVKEHWKSKRKLSKYIIKEALRNSTRPIVASSWGKDSMVLLDITTEVFEESLLSDQPLPKPAICFINTKLEFKEHLAFAKEQMKQYRDRGYEVFEEKPPIKNYKKFFQEIGLPIFGKKIRKKSNYVLWKKLQDLGINYSGNKCCKYLKEDVANRLYERINADLIITELHADEAQHRRDRWYKLGDHFFNKTEGRYKCTPLIHFLEEDIWEYHKKRNMALSPVYSIGYYYYDPNTGDTKWISYKRNGCWCCGHDLGHAGLYSNLSILRHTHNHLFDATMKVFGMGKEIFKFKKRVHEDKWDQSCDDLVNFYVKSKPCTFDFT